ncbi:unnamed protein product [Gulo gulo]|uniref:Uncharacterized protein n=1 Tax=Gulo gulo TaxID=48420 RepID=A0A9X9LMG5_GULGU|nr:unnamed protein product [Gulo gulo]
MVEEESSKEPPADLLRRAPSFPWHPIPDAPTPSCAPQVLLPGSASSVRTRSLLVRPCGGLATPGIRDP